MLNLVAIASSTAPNLSFSEADLDVLATSINLIDVSAGVDDLATIDMLGAVEADGIPVPPDSADRKEFAGLCRAILVALAE